nr:R3H domain-containing nucleic acid-binding protein [Adlercreutzia sp. ZJ242]
MTEEFLEEGGVADAAVDETAVAEDAGAREAEACGAAVSGEAGVGSDSAVGSAAEKSMSPDEREITDEMLDDIADTAIAALQDILKYFNVGDITIDEYEGDEGELILDITGDDLAVLIGRHGKTLDALQFLVSAITVRTIGFRYPVVIDVEGYKSRQRQKLESIARSSANRAVAQRHEVKLRPMTPYERRIVHITLRDDDRVVTASEGEGGARRVVITPR